MEDRQGLEAAATRIIVGVMSRKPRPPAFRRRPAPKSARVRNAEWKPARRMPGRGALVTALVFALAIGWFLLKEHLGPPSPQSEVAMTFRPCGTPGSGPCVIDGDTLAIGQRRVRLTGYDAPELDGACDAERHKAAQARDRLADWLAQGPFEWTGGTDPAYDRYGRELREARRGEELLAEVMVDAGLAEGDSWGAESVSWCSIRRS